MAEEILIATLGSEPQVVTLALDKLLSAGHRISRVVVIHTQSDQEPVLSALQILHEEFVEKQHYGSRIIYAPHLLAGENGPLSDVATTREIDEAFRSVYTQLRQHKLAGRTIHLCIAGGRKTMTMFAMAAAQILFEIDDYVWHVVSSKKLIHSRQMTCPALVNSSQMYLHLSSVTS